MTEPSSTAAPEPLIGKAIGNYVIRHKLGDGGMGAVYCAEHPAIGKRVALKVLHPELASQPEIVSRFFHEAKAVNDIQHPNIVDIIDYGVLASSGPGDPPVVYFLMEYIEGTPLSELLRRDGPLPIGRAMSIALQVADALSASHRKGIIHRDLKPDNVMLVPRGRDQDFVKLLDFGIAKLTGNSTTFRTRAGLVMGTPQFMSPEQCEGRSTIDHRTDVYALGIMLYLMLTGKVPFAAEHFGDVLVQQIVAPPMAPSLLAPHIPEPVELVVLKALEKQPGHRYQRIDDMIFALLDPGRYIASHGGRTGFLVSPVVSDPASSGAIAQATAPPNYAAPTTLNGSAGQVAGPGRSRTGPGFAFWFALASGIATPCAVAISVMVTRHTPTANAALPQPGAAKPIDPPIAQAPIVIDSTPPGAELFVGDERVGTTPHSLVLDSTSAPARLRLVHPGFRPLAVIVGPDSHGALNFTLEPR